MISLNSVTPVRFFSPSTEKLAPHRLTILFGLVVLGSVLTYYIYRRLNPSLPNPSLNDLGRQAYEKGEYQKAADYFQKELSELMRIQAPLDSPVNIAPYYGRNTADLKLGEFYRVIYSTDCAVMLKMDDELKAEFHLQKGQACLGLTYLGLGHNELEKAKESFAEALKLLPEKSKLLGQAHYLRGVASKWSGENDYAVKCCNTALEHIPEKDLELKVKVLILQSLAFFDRNEHREAVEAAHSALTLYYEKEGKIAKETAVVLYFVRAISSYGKKEFAFGLSYFEKALASIEENDKFLRERLTFQALYWRAEFATSYTDAQTALRELEEAVPTIPQDKRASRSELLLCTLQPIIDNLANRKTQISRLKIRNQALQAGPSS